MRSRNKIIQNASFFKKKFKKKAKHKYKLNDSVLVLMKVTLGRPLVLVVLG
jgi:hypothetical protein